MHVSAILHEVSPVPMGLTSGFLEGGSVDILEIQ